MPCRSLAQPTHLTKDAAVDVLVRLLGTPATFLIILAPKGAMARLSNCDCELRFQVFHLTSLYINVPGSFLQGKRTVLSRGLRLSQSYPRKRFATSVISQSGFTARIASSAL